MCGLGGPAGLDIVVAAAVAAPSFHGAIVARAARGRGGEEWIDAAIRALLEQHADVNAAQVDGMTALHWAAYHDDLETAGLLVHAGANAKAANRYGVTPLSLACTNGNAAIVELLLKSGADPNARAPRRRDAADDGRADRHAGRRQGAAGARRDRRRQG